jgi:bifunctional non-homologous end joining protein LigD
MRSKPSHRTRPTDKSGSLARYRTKRDFSATPEPRGVKARSQGDRYLIQKHAARRLHYDFRLELDGVLKSWAVTRGPSLDPADRRLAVHVEDHPLAYGDFEGIIPKPQYGGGTVMLWDQGSWEPLGDPHAMYRAGRLKFLLQGERLKGEWNLVRMKNRSPREKRENWLLIKGRDAAARSGDGDRLLEEEDRSVKSGRSMDEIARSRSVWDSEARQNGGKERPAAKDKVRSKTTKPPVASAKGAKRGELPDFVPPQLATRVEAPPDRDGWLHEIKLDGYRVQARCDRGKVRLLTRRGLDWSHRFAGIAEAVETLPAETALLDGEIVAFDSHGLSDFGRLQAILAGEEDGDLAFILFDLLHLDGYDLRPLPLLERKARLLNLLGETERGPLRFSQHFEQDGQEIYRHACELALEGVVSKRAQDPYRSGRSLSWLKSKCRERQEFIIGGFTKPAKGLPGVGALVLGYGSDGRFRYAGRVGTGFGRKQSVELRRSLERIRQDTPPFEGMPAAARRGVTFVEPALVCEVEFATWTRDGFVRQASFLGLREDKPASQIKREKVMARASVTPATAEEEKPARQNQRKRTVSRASAAPPSSEEQRFHGVRLTHPDKLLYEGQGITKRSLAQYYVDVADHIMPHVRRRPLAIVRCPDGAGGACFYQKHLSAGMPDAIKPFSVKGKSGRETYVSIEDERGLIALVQFGVLELHPWGASVDDVDKADRIIFDFDPAPGVEWPDVIRGAREVRDRLKELKLESFVKTTGGKGLHVVAPLKPAVPWDPVKRLTQAIAMSMASDSPDLYLATASKAARKGKIFVDYLRNQRGSTAVAPYSTRARAGAPISAPLEWRELTGRIKSDQYRVDNIRDRLTRLKRDPWEGFFELRQTLGQRTLAKLEEAR